MTTIVPVIIAAIKNGDKFLMTKRVHLDPEDKRSYHNAWQLPGGALNFGETPEQALKREIKEELGIKIKIIRLLPKIYIRIRRDWQGMFIVYLCQMSNPTEKIILDQEASAFGWFDILQIRKMKLVEGTARIMHSALIS